MAPSFAWCAVPLAFVALRALPFPVAGGVVAAMVATVSGAWTSMTDRFDPTIVVGPIAVAVLAVVAYRALDRQAAERQRLLEELREAQGDLADAQHQAGVVAERARLSREIHDSVAQGLSSINLRAGVRALLEGQDDLTVVGEAPDASSAEATVRRTRPDVALMDLNLGGERGGAEATPRSGRRPILRRCWC